MRPDWRTIVPAAALWGLALASCAPSPQAYVAEPLQGSLRIAVLPLANFSEAREAPDRLGPMIGVALSRIGNVDIVEPGRVEEMMPPRSGRGSAGESYMVGGRDRRLRTD